MREFTGGERKGGEKTGGKGYKKKEWKKTGDKSEEWSEKRKEEKWMEKDVAHTSVMSDFSALLYSLGARIPRSQSWANH